MKTIRVTGKGSIKVKPDTVRLRITRSEVGDDYKSALKLSSDMNEKLMSAIEKTGIDRKQLKTLKFNIDTEYENVYHEKTKTYTTVFRGYRFRHSMKLEFPLENELFASVLNSIAGCGKKYELRVEYTVNDAESVKNELIADAVRDSKAKAEILTRAADVKLGSIQTIDYSWGEVEFTSRCMYDGNMMADKICCDEEMPDMDFEPDDIETSDTVTVIWEIA